MTPSLVPEGGLSPHFPSFSKRGACPRFLSRPTRGSSSRLPSRHRRELSPQFLLPLNEGAMPAPINPLQEGWKPTLILPLRKGGQTLASLFWSSRGLSSRLLSSSRGRTTPRRRLPNREGFKPSHLLLLLEGNMSPILLREGVNSSPPVPRLDAAKPSLASSAPEGG